MTQICAELTIDEVGRKRKFGGQGAVLHDGVYILALRETSDTVYENPQAAAGITAVVQTTAVKQT